MYFTLWDYHTCGFYYDPPSINFVKALFDSRSSLPTRMEFRRKDLYMDCYLSKCFTSPVRTFLFNAFISTYAVTEQLYFHSAQFSDISECNGFQWLEASLYCYYFVCWKTVSGLKQTYLLRLYVYIPIGVDRVSILPSFSLKLLFTTYNKYDISDSLLADCLLG